MMTKNSQPPQQARPLNQEPENGTVVQNFAESPWAGEKTALSLPTKKRVPNTSSEIQQMENLAKV